MDRPEHAVAVPDEIKVPVSEHSKTLTLEECGAGTIRHNMFRFCVLAAIQRFDFAAAFVSMMNRATAETAHDAAPTEELVPV